MYSQIYLQDAFVLANTLEPMAKKIMLKYNLHSNNIRKEWLSVIVGGHEMVFSDKKWRF